MPEMIGALLNGRYRLDSELGQGGMGTVYCAHDTLLKRDVAVKVLSRAGLGTQGRARLLCEAQAVAQLNHPNVVSIYDAGEAELPGSVGTVPFIVMELVEGDSLHDCPPGSLDEILAVACQVCTALEHAHTHGVIHRDLKPENVLVLPDGSAKLVDFGLARTVDSRLTAEGAVLGTVSYIAPEQALGQEIDGRADLYTLGVMLYEWTTGRLPFTGDDPLALIGQHLHAPVIPPREHNPEIPPALDSLIVQLLSKQAEDRPASAQEVRQALDALGEADFPAEPSRPRVCLPGFLHEDAGDEGDQRPTFVARERELARLDGFLAQALAGHGRVVFITGEAGQGKTALVAEFARRAQAAHPDLVVAGGDCNAHTGIGDPYLPFREILELLTGDVQDRWTARAISQEQARRLWQALPLAVQALVEAGPDLIDLFLPGPAFLRRAEAVAPWPGGAGWLPRLKELVKRKAAIPGDPNLQQSALFEQYTQVVGALAGQRPLLLVLDDLQWVDGGSTNLLFHLGRRIQGSRVLIVGAYRPAEVALGRLASPREGGRERHPLEQVINEFKRRFGGIEVDLGQAEDRQFVEALLDSEPNRLGETFRETLYRQTRGHALSTVELLRDMQERGDLVQDSEGRWAEGQALDWEALPVQVEAVIAERVGRLAEPAREALRVASVEGETFTAEVVARVLGATELEVVRQLGRLDREHRLVAAQGMRRVSPALSEAKGGQRLSTYRFRHILFQRYVYNSLGEGERAYLHEDVGTALEALYGEGVEEVAVQLARHFQEAGIAEKAIDYLRQAGDRARRLYASLEAVGYYRRALVLLREQEEHEQAARTLMKLGLTYHNAFDFQQARRAYEEGFALWQRAGESRRQAFLSPPEAPHALRVDWTEPSTLDPTRAWDLYSACVIDQLFSGLVEYSPEMGITPDVAQGWEVSQGGRRYVFHLRDAVHWTDGTPVTAGDFEYAWKRVLDPASESANAKLLYDIKGARALHQGESSDPDRLGIRAIDDATLAVELEEPSSYFPSLLAHRVSYPLPRHVVQDHGERWTDVGTILTNGPFQLESWERGESLVLVRNPGYHGWVTGNAQRLELLLVPEWPVKLQMYEADRLDIMNLSGLPLPERVRTRQRFADDYVSAPTLGTMYVGFDASRPPFDDPRFRRAFVLAIDREYLAFVAMRGDHFSGTGGFIPPGMPGYSAEIGLPHDPDEARRCLAEMGHAAGCGLDPMDFLTFRRLESYGEVLVSQWQKIFGIEIAWEAVEYKDFLVRMTSEPPRIFLSGWTADYPDPDNFLRVSPVRRYTGWQNSDFDRLVEMARQVTDQRERISLYRQADAILIRETAIVPIAYVRRHLLVKPWIRTLPMSPIKHWFWKDVVIEPH